MQTTEINGFLMDEFNQHKLEAGKKQGVCPLCSADRKPKNQKAKCASYDWERGLGTCHNCDKTFQLHSYQRKGSSDKVYSKPETPEIINNVGTKVEEWFESRGISKETLRALKITEGPEFMPQTGKEENTIQFNYFIGGQLVNIKYRDGRKNFKLVKGAEKIFYNINNIVGHDWCVIVEGELDALSLYEVGITNVVSVPNGATLNRLNLDYLDNCIEYFDDKQKIILATDSDEAGQNLQQELIRRFGAEVCWMADFGIHKDANDLLVADGRNALLDAIHNSTAVPLENVVTVNDINDELEEFIHEGFKPGYQVGLDNFDSIFSTYTGQFITVTGVPSSGKSDFVDRMAVGYQMKYGWKTAAPPA